MKLSEITYNISTMMIMTAVISFLGFALENIWLSVRKGYMDNRNMHAPFLLGYGLTVMGFYLLLGTPENPRTYKDSSVYNDAELRTGAYFIMVFLCVSIGEILLGTFIEKAYGIILWDYTSLPLHMTRYTSVLTSIGFTVIIMSFMDHFEPIMDVLQGIEPQTADILGSGLMIVMTLDLVSSSSKMKRTGRTLDIWRINTGIHSKKFKIEESRR